MRIVSLAPSNTEIICRLGLEDDLVATTSLCDYPARAREIESVGGWSSGIDIEKLESLEPDIVLTSDSLQEGIRKQIDFAETLHVEPQTLEEVYSSFIKIGRRFGRLEQAENLVQEMKHEIDRLQSPEDVSVYCEEWSDPPYISANWIPDLLEQAGIDYPVNGGRSRRISYEELKSFEPDYIFLNVCGAGLNADKESLKKRDGWDQLEAVRKDRVEVIDDSLLNRPGPRLVEGLRTIVETLQNR